MGETTSGSTRKDSSGLDKPEGTTILFSSAGFPLSAAASPLVLLVWAMATAMIWACVVRVSTRFPMNL